MQLCGECRAWDQRNICCFDEFLSSPSVFGLCNKHSHEELIHPDKHGLEIVAAALDVSEGTQGEFVTRKDFGCVSFIEK